MVKTAALRIAEKLLPFINENNKIYFSVIPNGSDPDDFIKKNGKDKFKKLLKEKNIIQSFIWNHYINKIDRIIRSKFQNLKKKLKEFAILLKMKY